LYVSSAFQTKAADDWEGVWAQTKTQCLCEFFSVDTCSDGGGLPPLLINREKMYGPEISCRITKSFSSSRTSFDLQASCESEGNKGNARIIGVMNVNLKNSATTKNAELAEAERAATALRPLFIEDQD
jgi:hypothetical protein